MASNPIPIAAVGQSQNGDTTYNYLASAYVTLPAIRGNIVAKVQRIFQEQQISPWNFAIFYNDPLEIHPGPSFYIDGWSHTNSDLYTGHKSLDFSDKTTFAGHRPFPRVYAGRWVTQSRRSRDGPRPGR